MPSVTDRALCVDLAPRRLSYTPLMEEKEGREVVGFKPTDDSDLGIGRCLS